MSQMVDQEGASLIPDVLYFIMIQVLSVTHLSYFVLSVLLK